MEILFRTVLAYTATGHETRVNYYSNPSVILPLTGTPTGVAGVSDTARVITQNRFIMAANGDESATCKEEPVNGNWGSWSSWSLCSETCGGGIQTRTRYCNNPPPSKGGRFCEGSSTSSSSCNTQSCYSGLSSILVVVKPTAQLKTQPLSIKD